MIDILSKIRKWLENYSTEPLKVLQLGCVDERAERSLATIVAKRLSKNSALARLSSIPAVPFDPLQKILASNFDLNPPKSADALIVTADSIDFVEKKSLRALIDNQHRQTSATIADRVAKFDFASKINHSLLCIDNILLNKHLNTTKEEDQSYRQAKKNFYVVVDIDRNANALHLIAATFGHWAVNSTQKQTEPDSETAYFSSISETLTTIARPDQNLQPSRLFTCQELAKHYEKIGGVFGDEESRGK